MNCWNTWAEPSGLVQLHTYRHQVYRIHNEVMSDSSTVWCRRQDQPTSACAALKKALWDLIAKTSIPKYCCTRHIYQKNPTSQPRNYAVIDHLARARTSLDIWNPQEFKSWRPGFRHGAGLSERASAAVNIPPVYTKVQYFIHVLYKVRWADGMVG